MSPQRREQLVALLSRVEGALERVRDRIARWDMRHDCGIMTTIRFERESRLEYLSIRIRARLAE